MASFPGPDGEYNVQSFSDVNGATRGVALGRDGEDPMDRGSGSGGRLYDEQALRDRKWAAHEDLFIKEIQQGDATAAGYLMGLSQKLEQVQNMASAGDVQQAQIQFDQIRSRLAEDQDAIAAYAKYTGMGTFGHQVSTIAKRVITQDYMNYGFRSPGNTTGNPDTTFGAAFTGPSTAQYRSFLSGVEKASGAAYDHVAAAALYSGIVGALDKSGQSHDYVGVPAVAARAGQLLTTIADNYKSRWGVDPLTSPDAVKAAADFVLHGTVGAVDPNSVFVRVAKADSALSGLIVGSRNVQVSKAKDGTPVVYGSNPSADAMAAAGRDAVMGFVARAAVNTPDKAGLDVLRKQATLSAGQTSNEYYDEIGKAFQRQFHVRNAGTEALSAELAHQVGSAAAEGRPVDVGAILDTYANATDKQIGAAVAAKDVAFLAKVGAARSWRAAALAGMADPDLADAAARVENYAQTADGGSMSPADARNYAADFRDTAGRLAASGRDWHGLYEHAMDLTYAQVPNYQDTGRVVDARTGRPYGKDGRTPDMKAAQVPRRSRTVDFPVASEDVYDPSTGKPTGTARVVALVPGSEYVPQVVSKSEMAKMYGGDEVIARTIRNLRRTKVAAAERARLAREAAAYRHDLSSQGE